MTEKIYCSQCHNSVYTTVSHLANRDKRFGKDNICLYCKVLGKYLPKNKEIKGCVHLLPESVDKLMQGVWGVNKYYLMKRK